MARRATAASPAAGVPKMPADVAAVVEAVPTAARARMIEIRALIYETAAALPGVGPLTETLKWGEPAFLTSASKSGSTIRMAWKRALPDHAGVYFNCQTSLVADFRTLFPDGLTFEGNRAIILRVDAPLPKEALRMCLSMALTYHRDKPRR